jgi:hypothetical protein
MGFKDKRQQIKSEKPKNTAASVDNKDQKPDSPKKPLFGHTLFKGSLSEPDVTPIMKENADGTYSRIEDAKFPDGYTQNATTGGVTSVNKVQYMQNIQNALEGVNDPGYVSTLKWQSSAAMSMDGLLVPFATTFTNRDPKGIQAEYDDPAGSGNKTGKRPGFAQNRLPPYERPSNLIDYWHNSRENTTDDIGGFTDTVTSATLNPFAHGHHVSVLSRGETVMNVDTRASSGGQVGRHLGDVSIGPKEASRPFSLRGPLVMTGWGFNTEGKPVPNMKRDALYREDNPRSENFGMPINFPDELAEDMKNPSVKFVNNHLQRLDQWKTGPVDLRWDDIRKVWTSPGINRVYLSKATRCILPTGGPDGKNSWNFGVNNVVGAGRQYRNPCPSDVCKYDTYFPKSKYYPDIEIYDPEDRQWCGKCQVQKDVNGNPYVNCDATETACVPFYDAIILRSMGHIVSGRNVKSDCGDKFRKTSASDPYSKRMGNPCHGWGSSFDGILEYLPDKVEGQGESNEEYSEGAYSILYERIFIENPLSQGLMLGDSFLSYDTGRKITMTYMRAKDNLGCGKGGEAISVTESLPVHVILQAEFVGVEMVTNSSCEQGEWGACTRKVMVQGMTTPKDCGPDDDYPSTSIG